MANLWWIKRASVERREGGRGGQNEKKVNQLFWLLGFRESQGSRQSHAQKVTLPDKGAPRAFAGVDLAV